MSRLARQGPSPPALAFSQCETASGCRPRTAATVGSRGFSLLVTSTARRSARALHGGRRALDADHGARRAGRTGPESGADAFADSLEQSRRLAVGQEPESLDIAVRHETAKTILRRRSKFLAVLDQCGLCGRNFAGHVSAGRGIEN